MTARAALGVIAGLAIACRARDGGASPEAAVRAFVDACNADDPAAIRAAVVPADRLARALACPPDSATLAIAAAQADAYLTQNRGAALELIDVVVTRRSIAVGAAIYGCTAREPFEVATAEITARFAGQTTHDVANLAVLDGRWRVVPLGRGHQ